MWQIAQLAADEYPPVLDSRPASFELPSNAEFVDITGCTLDNRNMTVLSFTTSGGCEVQGTAAVVNDTHAQIFFRSLDAGNEGPLFVSLAMAGFVFPLFIGTVVPTPITVDAVPLVNFSVTTSTSDVVQLTGSGFNAVDPTLNSVLFSTDTGSEIVASVINATRTWLAASFSFLPPSAATNSSLAIPLYAEVDSSCETVVDGLATSAIVDSLSRGCPTLDTSDSASLSTDASVATLYGMGLSDINTSWSTISLFQNSTGLDLRTAIVADVVNVTRESITIEFVALDQSNFLPGGDNAIFAWFSLAPTPGVCFESATFQETFDVGTVTSNSTCLSCYQTAKTQLYAKVVAATPTVDDAVQSMLIANVGECASVQLPNATALCSSSCCVLVSEPSFRLHLTASGLPNGASSAALAVMLQIPALGGNGSNITTSVVAQTRTSVTLDAAVKGTTAEKLFQLLSQDYAAPFVELTALVSFELGANSSSLTAYSTSTTVIRYLVGTTVYVVRNTTATFNSTSTSIVVSGTGLLTILPVHQFPLYAAFPVGSTAASTVPIVVQSVAELMPGTNLSNSTYRIDLQTYFDPANAGPLFINMSSDILGWRSNQRQVQVGEVALVAPSVTRNTSSISSNAVNVAISGVGFSKVTSVNTVHLQAVCTNASNVSSITTLSNKVLASESALLSVELLESIPTEDNCVLQARVQLVTDFSPSGIFSNGFVDIGTIVKEAVVLDQCDSCLLFSNATSVTLSGYTFSASTTVTLSPTGGRPIVLAGTAFVDMYTLTLDIEQLGPSNQGPVNATACEGTLCSNPTPVFSVVEAQPMVTR